MLHFDLVYLARLHCASHQMNWAVTWCLRFSSPHSQAYFLLWGVLAKPDWTEAWTSWKAEPPSCSVAQLKAIVGVCISFCCCSVCLRIWQQNCHLLFCTCLCLWESCYSVSGCCATVNACVCVCGCRVVANPALTYTNYFMFFLKSSCFSWFALCSPKQGFVIKQVSQWCQIWWISLQSDFTDTLISEVRRYIFNKDLFTQVPFSCIGILQFSHTVTNNQHVHFSTSKYIWWITGSCTVALRAVTVWKLAFYLIYVLPID